MQDYDVLNDPFRNLTEDLTLYNKLKFFFPGLILMPIRLAVGIGSVMACAVLMKICTFGLRFKKGEPGKPLRGWRRIGPWVVCTLSRVLLFSLGFHSIKVTGTVASAEEAPIIVSNHLSPWEGFALMYYCGVTFVSRAENLRIPLFGTVLRGLQTISVNRDEASSREGVANEIKRRTAERGWPRTGIFPEGTVSNGRFLLQFRTGAFQAGVPVQPVVVRYRYRHIDPSWAGTRVGLGALTLRLVTQFYNSMELTFLPVYRPNEQEKQDPLLYANNVRAYMAEHTDLRLSNYSLEDYMVLTEAKKYGIGADNAILGVESLRKATNLAGNDIKAMMKSFHEMDKTNSGFISYTAFIGALGIPDSESTRRSFHDLCDRGKDVLSFRAFVQSVVHLSRNITTDEKLRMAFDIANVKGDGKITEDELGAVISIIAPEMSAASVHQLFRRIDTRRIGYVDFIEFGAFFRANPHYMQLFEVAREMERAKGENAVLDMLKRRQEGQSMTVDEFKASVAKYREQGKEQLSPRAS